MFQLRLGPPGTDRDTILVPFVPVNAPTEPRQPIHYAGERGAWEYDFVTPSLAIAAGSWIG